jgi:hypothetical protein
MSSNPSELYVGALRGAPDALLHGLREVGKKQRSWACDVILPRLLLTTTAAASRFEGAASRCCFRVNATSLQVNNHTLIIGKSSVSYIYTPRGHRAESFAASDVNELVELRARQRTFGGAYTRTALGM